MPSLVFIGGMMLVGLIVAIFVGCSLIEFVRLRLTNVLVERVAAWGRFRGLKERLVGWLEKRWGWWQSV